MDNLATMFRRYHRTHCETDHAKLIAEGLRQDRLSYDDVAIMAVLGHRPSQFALAYCHHSTCFVYHDRLIKTIEPKDIIQELKRWGAKATISAACGVLRTSPMVEGYDYDSLLSVIENNIHSYERPRGIRGPKKTVSPLVTIMKNRGSLPVFGWHNNVYNIAIRELKRDLQRNLRYPGLHPLTILNGTLDDATMMSGMRNGLIDKALGEFA
jgi:hypothetical protein